MFRFFTARTDVLTIYSIDICSAFLDYIWSAFVLWRCGTGTAFGFTESFQAPQIQYNLAKKRFIVLECDLHYAQKNAIALDNRRERLIVDIDRISPGRRPEI